MLRIFLYATLIMGSIGGVEYLRYDQNNLNDERGERAIRTALNACSTRNGIVYAAKLAEAKSTIDELRSDRAQWYGAKLDTQLRLVGCKP